MSTQLNLFKSFKINYLSLLLLSSSLIGQNIGSDGMKSYQMQVTKGNLASFSKTEKQEKDYARYNAEKTNHPEFGALPFNAAYNGFVEVLNKREVDQRLFVNPKAPSEIKIQKSLTALHYKVNGEWVTVDHRLADKGNGIYEASNQFDPVGFNTIVKKSYIKTPSGQIDFNNWKLFGSDENGTEELIALPNWSDYTVGDDGMYIKNVFPGIDAQMIVNRGSVKTNFIIKSVQNPNYKNLVFKDDFTLPLGSFFKFENGGSASVSKSAINLINNNETVLEIGEANAYPENGTKADNTLMNYSIAGNKLSVIVPVSWIQTHIGKGNVIIDPLVSSSNTLAQASITGSMYNASCGFTNSCNYNLSVNTPANTTLTNASWSFNYIANGTCWLQDGAVKYTTGACTSPSATGFYWYCNAVGGGTCTGNNISIWNDVRTCMPAPSCAPVSVPFTMQFFRSCFGAAGCSGTCIGANSPWTMTLDGRTVEFTNVVTPFSLSSTSVCAGSNITATSNGVQYGVPAYNINWSFSPTGIPSVGTGNSPSINFPTAGVVNLYAIVTDACGITATASRPVTVVAIPTANAGTTRNLTCIQTTTVLNGTGGGTYSWSGPGTITTPTSQNPTVNTPGTFTLIVNVAACNSAPATVVVSQNTTVPVNTAGTSNSITCTNNSINLTSSTGGLTYTWTAPGGSSITGGVNNQNTTGSGAGTYTVRVTDAVNGCTNIATVAALVNTTVPAPTAGTSASVTCTNSVINLTSNPAGLTYTWTAPGGSSITGGVNNQNTTGSGAGTYTVRVTNAVNGCTNIATVAALVNTVAPTTTAGVTGLVTCSSPAVSLTSGPSGMTYTWTAPGGSSITGGVNNQNTTGSGGGTYTVLVQNPTNGCSTQSVVTASTNTTLPSPSITAPSTITCANPTITLNGNPGSGVTYTWSGPGIVGSANNQNASVNQVGNYTLTVTNSVNGCTNSVSASVGNNTIIPTTTPVGTQTITCATPSVQLIGSANPSTCTVVWTGGVCAGPNSYTASACAAGNYTYIATNPANGCQSAPQVATVVPNAGIPTATLSNTGTITCISTSVQVIGTTTTSPATYTWSGPGIVGAANTPTINVNQGGVYTLTLTNTLNGCTSVITNSITANNAAVTPTTTSSTIITCTNPTSTLTTNVGAGSYTYNWSGPGIVTSNTLATVTSSLGGTYNVTVTNTTNGCVGIGTISVASNTTVPGSVTVTPSSFTLSCATPTTQIIVGSTGSGTTYSWTAPGTGNILSGSNTPTASISGPGVYSVVATATNGCSAAVTTATMVADVNSPNVTLSSPNLSITCLSTTPSLTLTPTGTVAIASYSWSPASGISSGSNTTTPTFTAAGTYSCLITAANGCTITATIPVTNNTVVPTATTSAIVNISCSSTSVDINPTYTPSTGLTYTWTGTGIVGSANNSSVTVNQSGTYTVSMIDPVNGCASTATVTVNGNTVVPTVTVTATSSIGIGCLPTNTAVTLDATTTPSTGITYAWSTTATTQTISVSTAGIYTVVVTDAVNGCSVATQYTVTNSSVLPNVSAGANANIPCGGLTTTVTLNGNSTDPGVNYAWVGPGIISGSNTATPIVNVAGTYTLTVTNPTTGCSATSTVDVINAVPTASISSDVVTGFAPLTVNFGNTSTNANTFSWNFGNGSTTTLTTTAGTSSTYGWGTYTITMIASSGLCSDTASIIIVVEDGFSIEVPNVFTPNDDNINDVFTITSTGVKEITLKIFNRWGQPMYDFSGAKASWDGVTSNGQKASNGTYFYFIKATGFDGKEYEKNGPVSLFR
ncbi:MAG: gliding motility-associated C-terminal domain-containing protein [Bacteroidia bacterium]|nr:gliding motility-associated C-terminal domain-containing protein [Bacteroidia bacterium]